MSKRQSKLQTKIEEWEKKLAPPSQPRPKSMTVLRTHRPAERTSLTTIAGGGRQEDNAKQEESTEEGSCIPPERTEDKGGAKGETPSSVEEKAHSLGNEELNKRSKQKEGTRQKKENEARKNRAATTIQTRWRTHRAKKNYQVKKKLHVYRTLIVEEILSTEENYVTTLREVVENFLRPLKEAAAGGKPIVSHDEIKTIFSNIQIILGYNDALLEDLRKKFAAWHPFQLIGDVFLKMAAFMKVYTDYVRNFNDALATIQECRKVPEFQSFCAETYPKMSVVQADITAYLIVPVQRIPRYQLLLKNLLEHTWKEHCDYNNIEQALQQITTTAIYVNDKHREADNIQKMLNIQSSLYGKKLVNLVDPQRRFMREGCLTEIKLKGKGKPRWFILFNDLMVKCKMSNTLMKKSLKKGTVPAFEYIGQLSLEGCELVNSGDEGDKKYGFQVNSSTQSLWLCASSESEKFDWMKDLKQCIRSLKEKSDFYDEQATKIASQRAEAAKALIAEQYTGYRVRGAYVSASGSKRSEYRRGSLAGNDPDIPADGETDMTKTSLRSLSAQERFNLTKQAEHRLSQLLEEEKQHEQIKNDAINERVKHFKDSVNKRYSNGSEATDSLVEGSDCEDDSSFMAALNEATSTPGSLSRRGSSCSLGASEDGDGPLTDSSASASQPGRRRFASMKREHYRSAGTASKSNSLQGSDREILTAVAGTAKASTDAGTGQPKTRKFVSLKRDDYRNARSGRLSLPLTSSTAATETPPRESDVIIHEDEDSALPQSALDAKKNYATGRKKYPSMHIKDMKSAADEFDHNAKDRRKKSKTITEATRSEEAEEGEADNALRIPDQGKKHKRFSSLQRRQGEEALDEVSKKYDSVKRENFKSSSATFEAIDLKDMVALAKPPATSDVPPRRRFASMKRESYKSAESETANTCMGE